MGKRATLSEWLERAYAPGEDCPPPEIHLSAELERLSSSERRRFERHADACPACAAERKLAAAFEATEPSAAERRDVEAIARRLERRAPHRSSGRRAGLEWGAWLRLPAFQLAAALVLLLGVGLVYRQTSPPPLAGRTGPTVTRSANVELLSPLGTAEVPAELVWRPVEGATRYQVVVFAIDEAELWRRETSATRLAVDSELRALLRPAVAYLWQVVALDATGDELARSARLDFRIEPTAGESG